MLVRRSKSSAILPLRKHLIEKTLMEQKALDEEQQIHFQSKDKVYDYWKSKSRFINYMSKLLLLEMVM